MTRLAGVAAPHPDAQLARLLAGLDPASPVVPTSVRPGVPFVRGTIRAAAPTAGMRARFRALELQRHGRRRPPAVRAGRPRRDHVGRLAQAPSSATSRADAVVGAQLGFAWGVCGGRGTRRGLGRAVLAHRPPTARTRSFAR